MLSKISRTQSDEIYYALYQKQQELGLSDDCLLSSTRINASDEFTTENFKTLLQDSLVARDNLIIWYLKQNAMQLNVMISLLTAKIKLLEYKIFQCDGLDLHQALSLSLVNFCNILEDMTVINVEPAERKTMHMVSAEANIPVWLSHYRNQICHVPSESPCISILIPLIFRSLDYMKESFWSKLHHVESSSEKFEKLIVKILKIVPKHKTETSNKRQKLSEQKLSVYDECDQDCIRLRQLLMKMPDIGIQVIAKHMIGLKATDLSANGLVLLEQIIFTKGFERFVMTVLGHVEREPSNTRALDWLQLLVDIISFRKRADLKNTVERIGLERGVLTIRNTVVSPLKCCHLAFRLGQLDNPITRAMIISLRSRLQPILGKSKTSALIRLNRVAGLSSKRSPKK